uniref:Uncharacterized protein n=1 Tax=Spumella elongata TaxID=89044 RepID=A0A7S3H7C3_9STRA|mmetsp:Transcript_38253/g.66004  ORF Transcript_38253/g.66004 Transcript_38253/m.66004 type:complete len:410 (+) Transcript_38253:23-1252(+)
MLAFLLVTLLSVFVTAIVSGGNEESYIQPRDILGWKVEEVRRSTTFRRVLSQSQSVQNQFSRDGYVSVGHFFGNNSRADSTCSSPTLVSGIAANRCKEAEGYWYSFQLFEDSCKGGLIHFFYDDECMHLTGVSELESMADRCQVDALNQFDHPVYTLLQCTTTVKAAIPPSSYLINYYDGNSCNAPVVAFDAYAASTCIFMSKTQQLYINSTLPDAPKINVYNGNTNCKGTVLHNLLLSTVCLNDQTDDDHALLPFIDPAKGRHLSSLSPTPKIDTTTAMNDATKDYSGSPNVLAASIVLPRQLSKLKQNSKSTISTQGVCIYPLSPDDDKDSDSLSAGAIVGIVMGTIIGIIVLSYAGYIAYTRYYGYAPLPTINALESPMRPGTEMSSRLMLNDEYKDDVGMFELGV